MQFRYQRACNFIFGFVFSLIMAKKFRADNAGTACADFDAGNAIAAPFAATMFA